MTTNDKTPPKDDTKSKVLKEELDVETRKRLNEYKSIQKLRHYNEVERSVRNSKA